MRLSFPDIITKTTDNAVDTFESSASDISFLDYSPLQRNIPDIREAKRKERLRDVFLAIPSSIVGLNKSENVLADVASGNDRIVGIINKPPYEITEAAENFIRKQKKSIKFKEDIIDIAERVTYFLRKKGIDAKVHIDLFTDPEYSDWIEPKIQIQVKKENLQKTYESFDELLNYSYLGMSQKTLGRLSVTIDSE